MEKSNQHPKTEGCLAEGEPGELWFFRNEQLSRSVPREKREPQAGVASCLSNTASKELSASGDGFCLPEPKTEATATGEVAEGLPGSKSVARAKGNTRNEGGLKLSRRTNYASQAGIATRRQGALVKAVWGVGSARCRSLQGESPEVTEGADDLAKSTQATSSVRLTEQNWQTFLWAIDDVSGRRARCGKTARRDL
jgi:hypothetical protein